MAKEKWVQGAFNPAHKGMLHRQLGIPEGERIPVGRLKAAAAKGGKVGKRAQLALTARSFKR